MSIVIDFLFYVVLFFAIFKLIFFIQRKIVGQKKNLYKMIELELLRVHFKVDIASYKIKDLQNIVALGNALVFSIVFMGTSFINNYLLRLLGMFVLLIPVIYFIYLGISKLLKRKENKNV